MSWRDKIAKAILGGKTGGPTPGGIHVYHSSPHDFDRFENRLLTGEGANVYGAGTYLAENPRVSGQGGTYWNQFLDRMEGPDRVGGGRLRALDFDRAKAIESAQRDVTDWRNKAVPADPAYAAKMLKMREDELRLLESGAPVGPRTYEVNFKAKPEQLLDWDKPLKQQPQVLDTIRDRFVYPFKPEETGASVYTGFVSYPYGMPGTTRDRAKQIISDKLGEAGIPGIRYLDEGSRVPPPSPLAQALMNRAKQANPELEQFKPTHNYVAFDPSKLDIMAKYGVIGGVPLGASVVQDNYGSQ